MNYVAIKHGGHLRTRGKFRKHERQASVLYNSRVFSDVRSVLSQCNTRARLRYLLSNRYNGSTGSQLSPGCAYEFYSFQDKCTDESAQNKLTDMLYFNKTKKPLCFSCFILSVCFCGAETKLLNYSVTHCILLLLTVMQA